jgi:hypothetical protein
MFLTLKEKTTSEILIASIFLYFSKHISSSLAITLERTCNEMRNSRWFFINMKCQGTFFNRAISNCHPFMLAQVLDPGIYKETFNVYIYLLIVAKQTPIESTVTFSDSIFLNCIMNFCANIDLRFYAFSMHSALIILPLWIYVYL